MVKRSFSIFLQQVKEGKFVIERVLSRYQLLIGLFYIWLILYTNSQILRPQLTFYTIRSIIIFFAFLFDRIRKNDKYYFAGFKEMPPSTYWRFVALGIIVLRVPFLRYFTQTPAMSFFHIMMSTFIIGLLLMSYQSQYWAFDIKKNDKKKIAYLIKKANLTESEFEAIKPTLIEHNNQLQKAPLLWKIMIAVFSIVLGIMLNEASSDIVDFILNILNIKAIDYLPPFQ